MRTGIASFTLDAGRCPAWLFGRMKRLARAIGQAIVEEFGTDEFLRRLSDPVWFQSFGSVLAFDWNASGLTTTTLGALKEGLAGLEEEIGLFVCGGKGARSRRTPQEILAWGERALTDADLPGRLVYASKMAAKVDSALVQDGFQLYHHSFLFTRKGKWAVIQQGMNTAAGRARRYHWLGERVDDFTFEPHAGIQSQILLPRTLNLTHRESTANKRAVLEIIRSPGKLIYEIRRLSMEDRGRGNRQMTFLELADREFHSHPVLKESFASVNFAHPQLAKNIEKLSLAQPTTFASLLMTPQVGEKTVRALTLIAELVYGAKPSYEDPARYTFAHGGKDGTPYPVDRTTYDASIDVIERAVSRARDISLKERDNAIRRAHKVFLGSNRNVAPFLF